MTLVTSTIAKAPSKPKPKTPPKPPKGTISNPKPGTDKVTGRPKPAKPHRHGA